MSKLCVNCVHYFNLNGACLLTRKMSTDYVTGKMESRYNYAKNERLLHGSCGEKGDLYKAESNALVKFTNKHPYTPGFFIFGCMVGIGYILAQ